MKYRVLEKSFIRGRIVEEGEVIEFDGNAGSNLELIKEAAKPKGRKSEVEEATE